jgi:hypothetical protein
VRHQSCTQSGRRAFNFSYGRSAASFSRRVCAHSSSTLARGAARSDLLSPESVFGFPQQFDCLQPCSRDGRASAVILESTIAVLERDRRSDSSGAIA